MNKLIKIGLNAMVAFTMIFAATAVVAQEKVVASNDLEVSGAVDANVLAGTVKKINVLLSQQGGDRYFEVPANTEDWADIGNWQMEPNSDCTGTGNICRVRLNPTETLQDFLDANQDASYSEILQHPQIDQKT